MNNRYILKVLRTSVLAFGLSFFIILISCSDSQESSQAGQSTTDHRLIVIGFDGMDYELLKNLISKGKLPNFEKLSKDGDFKQLRTSVPPQSPVAWSNFITGMNPGGHGIFDFIHRDPETMFPYLSTSKTEQAQKTVTIGKWVIPISSGEVKLLRQGKAFWEYLTEENIPTTIFRVPANFPTISSTNAKQISGMGTPDIQGTYGTFSYYTDDPPEDISDISGGQIIPVKVKNNIVTAKLPGPINTFKKNTPESKVKFKVFIDPENPVAKIVVNDQQIILKEGEWSNWVKIKYSLVPLIEDASGIVRFYVKELHPQFKMYVSPVNIDPSSPALPISTPEGYAKELANEIGLFYTQGIPEDTKALSEEVLTDNEFLDQTNIVISEQLRMLEYELDRFKSGLLFFYIGRVDQLSHMFWRTMDPKHPAYDSATKLRGVIEEAYIEMDGVLARLLEKVDDNTTIIVLSDHGFAPFYRAFNLNTWLNSKGYITLTDDQEGEFFQNVDWNSTQAYGVGFNGLYLNLQGREKQGIVEPWEKEELLSEISEQLLKIRDPKNGEQVVSKVYRANEVYSGPNLKDSPDLIVGYNIGYRASWETVLGGFPKETLRDNTEKWSGDHLMEADLVPGILLSNKKIISENPALYDLAPTILSEFDIPKQEGMIGNNFFNAPISER
ncbi:MAG: alkaline phosphatase family protein [Candidatus Dadabacteria bacterium]|nr:alkaline phosphatase family protein [Candidatus Dadabacteria bacterium]